MSIKKRYLINVLAQGIGRVFTIGVNFIVIILIARRMGVEQFGQYTYFITFLALIVIASEFGTQSVLAKDIAQVEDKRVYWGNYLLIRAGLTILTIGIALAVTIFLRKDLQGFLIIGSLALPLLNSRFFEPIFQVFHKPWFSTLTSLAYGTSYLIFSLWGLFFQPGLKSLVIAYLVANGIYTVLTYSLAFKILKPVFQIRKALIRSLILLALPIGVSSIFTIVNSKIDIFMLAHMKSDSAVGLYNAAYRFLDIISILASMMMVPLIPIFSKWAVENKQILKKNYMRIIEIIIITLIPIAVIIPLISEPLMTLVFGADFITSARILNILVWVGILVFISLINSASNLSVGEVNHAYWNSALATSANITMNYFWIPRYSYIGSTWATLISEIMLTSVSLFYVIKTLGNVFDDRKWIKILSFIVLFGAAIHFPLIGTAKWITVCLSIILYSWSVWYFHLLDLNFIMNIFKKKQERGHGN